jgi:hypothetical protein
MYVTEDYTGYEEIRDRKLLEILKKDRTWFKYELHCNVKTPAPLFFQNNFTFVIQMLINVFPRIVFENVFRYTFISVNNRGRAPSKYVNKLAIGFYFFIPEVKQYGQS